MAAAAVAATAIIARMITFASQSTLRRPQLAPSAPVIPRPGSQFQVGLDPRTALVFTGAGFGDLLGCLDGHHSIDDLEAAGLAAGLSTAEVSMALHRLREAGLLARRPDPGRSAGTTGSD